MFSENLTVTYELGLRVGMGLVMLKIGDIFQIDGNISFQKLKVSEFNKIVFYDLNSLIFQIGLKWKIGHIF